MARSEARLQLGIWQEGLDGLSAHARLVYCVVLTERTVNHAGVGAIRRGKWARNAALTIAELDLALGELQASQHVLFDENTDEFLVRTMIRNDGVADQPYILKGAIREALLTESPMLRRALARELRRLPPRRPDGVSKAGKVVVYPDPHAAAYQLESGVRPPPEAVDEAPEESVSEDTQDPSETLFETPGNPSVDVSEASAKKGFERVGGRGGGRGGGGGSVTTHSPLEKRTIPAARETRDRFEEFWSAYPRRDAKIRAEKAYRSALRRKGVTEELLISKAKEFAAVRAKEDPKFTPMPATWLNGGSYLDESLLRLVAGGTSGYQPYEDPPDDEYDEPMFPEEGA